MINENVLDKKAHSKGFTGWHMLLLMVAFFGVIITVNITMAMLASKSWTGLVVKNSYVASQSFNKDLAAAQAQRSSGVNSQIRYANGQLLFSLFDKKGDVRGAHDVRAEIGRPAFEQADKLIEFQPRGRDKYAAAIDLAPGIWALRIKAVSGDMQYRRDARIYVDKDGGARVE